MAVLDTYTGEAKAALLLANSTGARCGVKLRLARIYGHVLDPEQGSGRAPFCPLARRSASLTAPTRPEGCLDSAEPQRLVSQMSCLAAASRLPFCIHARGPCGRSFSAMAAPTLTSALPLPLSRVKASRIALEPGWNPHVEEGVSTVV